MKSENAEEDRKGWIFVFKLFFEKSGLTRGKTKHGMKQTDACLLNAFIGMSSLKPKSSDAV